MLATWHWHIEISSKLKNIPSVVKESGFTSYNTEVEVV